MIDFELEFVRENPASISVLRAYQEAEQELAAREKEAGKKSEQIARDGSQEVSAAKPSPSENADADTSSETQDSALESETEEPGSSGAGSSDSGAGGGPEQGDSAHNAPAQVDSAQDDSAQNENGSTADGSGSRRKRAHRWVPRLTKVADVEAEELSRLHGGLIAHDLLKCDLTDRSTGMAYRLTPSGRQLLSRLETEDLQSGDLQTGDSQTEDFQTEDFQSEDDEEFEAAA